LSARAEIMIASEATAGTTLYGELVGRQLRHIRQARRLSREELAGRVGILPNDLLRIEKGEHRVGLDTLFSLLEHIGMTLEDFTLSLRREAQAARREDRDE
jgi:transcriptional regulator with XRE-family HTH domain